MATVLPSNNHNIVNVVFV